MRYFLLLVVCLLLTTPGHATVKVIALQHRDANEVLGAVRELLQPEEKISAAGQSLVLIAEGESLLAVEKLIALLDRPLLNLRVKVRQASLSQQAGKDTSAAIHYGTSSGVSGSAGVGFRRSNTTTSLEQTLLLVEGGRGLIEVGQDIPFTEQWSVVTGAISGYAEKTAYKTIRTGFWIDLVAIQGENVLIEVEPYLSTAVAAATASAAGGPKINHSQLHTQLLVPLAQWYPLGSHLRQRDEISRAIISWRSRDGQEDRSLEIRIEMMQ